MEAQESTIVEWDDGSGLNDTDIDRVHKVAATDEAVITLNPYGQRQRETDSRCPRCGKIMWGLTTRYALSGYAKVYICGR